MTEKSTNIDNKNVTPKHKKLWGEKRLQFKNKRINLSHNPRQNKCSWCKKGIGDEYIDSRGNPAKIKRMHLHHIEYHEEDPLKDTFTLCPSCHLKESQRLRKLNQKPRICGVCGSMTTRMDKKRYKSGKVIEFFDWNRNPFDRSQWLCNVCYESTWWKYTKERKNKNNKKLDSFI
jgi:hypothetical protein